MIEHAAEIRQEFLVMHDAAPGAETEFQPASGGVMIGTGPQRCAPVEPGEEVRIGTIAARRKDDIAAAKRLSARLQAADDAVLDDQAVDIAAQFQRHPACADMLVEHRLQHLEDRSEEHTSELQSL